MQIRCPCTLAVAGWVACATSGCAAGGDPNDGESEFASELDQAAAQRVLDLVNYPGVDGGELDTLVGLDARAARAIHAHRAGVDGRFPSLDDDRFETIAELDAIAFVGDAAFAKLAAFAAAHPAPANERHENIVFAGWQAEIAVWGVNTVPIGVLEGMLDDRAAHNLVSARPFASLAAIAAVPLIADNALGRLRAEARTWWFAREAHPGLAGTFDGVAFDEPTARQALEVANAHTRDQMVGGGVVGNGASVIVGNRPYTTLAQVAAVSGVGPATMQSLHAYARSLLTPRVPEDGECTATAQCASGLVCAGVTHGAGFCRPDWMAGTFSDGTDVVIPDTATAITRAIEVTGLASVPEDLIVHLDIDHPHPEDLRILVFQPSSAELVIWDVDSSGLATVVVGSQLERDSSVNGTWTLQITDHFGGNTGTLRGWSLELTSRFD